MKKKLLFSLLLVLSLTTLIGCDTKKNETKTTTTTKEIEGNISVGEDKIALTEKGIFEKMEYLAPKRATVESLGTYNIHHYYKYGTDQELFRIGITKFYGKPETVMGDTVTNQGIKNYNGIAWEVYTGEKNVKVYAYYYDYDTYTVNFYSEVDTTELEEEFMKNVKFN